MDKNNFSVEECIDLLMNNAYGKAPTGFRLNGCLFSRLYDVFQFLVEIAVIETESHGHIFSPFIDLLPGKICDGRCSLKVCIELCQLDISESTIDSFIHVLCVCADSFSVTSLEDSDNILLEISLNGIYIKNGP